MMVGRERRVKYATISWAQIYLVSSIQCLRKRSNARGDGKIQESIADLDLKSTQQSLVNLELNIHLLASTHEGGHGLLHSLQLLLLQGLSGDDGHLNSTTRNLHKLLERSNDSRSISDATIGSQSHQQVARNVREGLLIEQSSHLKTYSSFT